MTKAVIIYARETATFNRFRQKYSCVQRTYTMKNNSLAIKIRGNILKGL